jgi:hypothetical protein
MGENRGHGYGFRLHIRRVLVEIRTAPGKRKRRAGYEQILLHWAEIPLAEFTAGLPYRFWTSSHSAWVLPAPSGCPNDCFTKVAE